MKEEFIKHKKYQEKLNELKIMFPNIDVSKTVPMEKLIPKQQPSSSASTGLFHIKEVKKVVNNEKPNQKSKNIEVICLDD